MRATENSDGCECIDGHVRAQGASGCTPCPAGSYADGNECKQCAAGTAAELAASVECTACLSPLVPNAARTLCVPETAAGDSTPSPCEAGSGGTPCTACQPGYFSTATMHSCTSCTDNNVSGGTSATTCTACPENATAINDHTACACRKGFGGQDCAVCGDDAYAPGGTDLNACTKCDANMRATENSDGCECIDGHVRAQGASGCTPCPAGSYADGNECKQCAAGTAAELAASVECTACLSPLVPNAARTLCVPEVVPADDTLPTCEAGSAGTPCTTCQPGSWSDGTMQTCAPCADNKTSAEGATECTPCPDNATANKDHTACACDKGFGGSDCALCATDSYSPGSDLSECTKCGPNMKANDDSNGCVCNAGYVPARLGGKGCTACPAGTYEDNGVCKACAKGKITESAGSSQCTACPALSVPNAARTQCVCKAGYGRAPGSSSCTACPAGTYSDATMITCKQCQTDRISAAKATVCVACTGGKVANVGQTKCVCKDGQGGATCKKCNVGNYSNASTNYLCVPCATGIAPASGAAKCTECAANKIADATRTACVCLDGYGGDANGDCAQCKAGQYSSADTNPPHTCQYCDLESIASAAGSATCATCETSKIPNALHTVCVPPGSEDGATYKLQTVITGDASCMSYDAAGALTMQPCSADAASQKFVWTWTIPEANPANAYGLLKSGALCADFTGGTTLSAVKMKTCKTAANQSQRWTNARVLCADGECTWQFGNRAAPTAADAAARLLVKTPSLSGSAKVVMGAPTTPGTNAEWFFRKW
eukprot:TRINITY_DN292_c0_g1_i2.p1 TRINITY_DN292_c0_g1~~TRINITY_DN292_c0_g1_i2.p1  ORF type:complete len:877 (-),score=187.70 TRINITY_DN292_c0_g1_i2:607-2943(-)